MNATGSVCPKACALAALACISVTQQAKHHSRTAVRRVNEQCIELESFANLTRSGSAIFIGMSIIAAIGISVFLVVLLHYLEPEQKMGVRGWLSMLFSSGLLVLVATLMFLGSVTHRNRGAFIRLYRGTRKLYYTFPDKKHLHVLNWDQLEVLAGYIPIVSSSGYATRHPLYLIGVDYALPQPAEVCVACGGRVCR